MTNVGVLQSIGPGDIRSIVVNVFPSNKVRPNPITLRIGGVGSTESSELGYRIDRALGLKIYGDHLLRYMQADSHFSPSGVGLTPQADMAFIAAIISERLEEAIDIPDKWVFSGESSYIDFLPLENPLSAGLAAKREDKVIVCNTKSAKIAALTGVDAIGVDDVYELTALVCGSKYSYEEPISDIPSAASSGLDMKYVKGQEKPKRAVEIAVAGMHNMLLVGPPGEGKSLMSKVVPTISPPMSTEEMVETTAMYMQKGLVDNELITSRPVREVSPSATQESLLGGGSKLALPGDVSLAHNGVLVCDEILQFKPSVIEAMRSPMQDGVVVINRVNFKVTWPAQFQLVATCNPCPCGYWKHPTLDCTCTPSQKRNYSAGLSGPVADRIPVRVWVDPLGDEKYEPPNGEDSQTVRERVVAARNMQIDRQGKTNNDIGPVDQHLIVLSPEGDKYIRKVSKERSLSTRAHDNLRKVSRTIADLDRSEYVDPKHIHEAALLLVMPLPRR